MEYRKDIQGLRAIAVLFVFVFHLNSSWLPGGFIGVDIFFVISGYLMSSIILKKREAGKFSLVDFYKSRIKRIVPAYYFMIMVVLIASVFVIFYTEMPRRPFIESILFNSNWYFSTLDTYFGVSNLENPLLHTWTLAVEMKFYLFLPLLLLMKRKYLLPIASLLTALLFLYGTIAIVGFGKQTQAYYILLSRAPEFLVGVLINLLPIGKSEVLAKHKSILGFLGVLLLIGSACFINGLSPFPGLLAAIPCIGTAFIILFAESKVNKILATGFFFFIGELSYSLYLWHWPVMALFRYYYDIQSFTISQYLWVVLLSVLLSLFSFYCIENPLRRRQWSIALYSITGMLVVCVFSMLVIIPLKRSENPLPEEYTKPFFGTRSHSSSFEEVETFGDPQATFRNVLLLGNSHARTMKYYFDYLGKRHSFSYRTITGSGYPSIEGMDKQYNRSSILYEDYLKIYPYIRPEIDGANIIILQYRDSEELYDVPVLNLLNNLKENQYVVLMSAIPVLDKNPLRMNRSITRDSSKYNSYEIIRETLSEEFIKQINEHPRAFYLDLSDSKVFDDAPFYNDTLMYYDKLHINIYGAKVYAQDTEEKCMHLLDSLFNVVNANKTIGLTSPIE